MDAQAVRSPYNSSIFSPLSAEVAGQLAFLDGSLDGHRSRGTKIIPFSRHNIDEILDDPGLNLSPCAGPSSGWWRPPPAPTGTSSPG